MYVRLLNHLVVYAELLSMYVGLLDFLRFGLINEIRLTQNCGLECTSSCQEFTPRCLAMYVQWLSMYAHGNCLP